MKLTCEDIARSSEFVYFAEWIFARTGSVVAFGSVWIGATISPAVGSATIWAFDVAVFAGKIALECTGARTFRSFDVLLKENEIGLWIELVLWVLQYPFSLRPHLHSQQNPSWAQKSPFQSPHCSPGATLLPHSLHFPKGHYIFFNFHLWLFPNLFLRDRFLTTIHRIIISIHKSQSALASSLLSITSKISRRTLSPTGECSDLRGPAVRILFAAIDGPVLFHLGGGDAHHASDLVVIFELLWRAQGCARSECYTGVIL